MSNQGHPTSFQAQKSVALLVRRCVYLMDRFKQEPYRKEFDRKEIMAVCFALDCIEELYPGSITDEQVNRIMFVNEEIKSDLARKEVFPV